MKPLIYRSFLAVSWLVVLFVALELISAVFSSVPKMDSYGDKEFFQSTPRLGQKARPGASVRVGKRAGDFSIYTATYSSGHDGWRRDPSQEQKKSGKFFLVVGSSHAFGVGVNDDETIPHYLGQLFPQEHIYNLAMPSFGLNSFEVLSENLPSQVNLQEQSGEILLFFHSLAVERTLGTFKTVFWGNGEGPHFRWGKDSWPEYLGSFRDSRPIFTRLSMYFSRLHLFHFWNSVFPARLSEEELELACSMVVHGSERLLRQYPGSRFRIVLVHDQFPKLRECLASHNVPVFVIREDGLPMIPLDGHYTPEGNRKVAGMLKDLLNASPAPGVTDQVPLENGTAVGRLRKDSWLYAALPYAEPPVGKNRWKSALPFRGEFNQRKTPVACPQFAGDGLSTETPEQSEDCLYVNVWTPTKPSVRSLLPVVIWFHGGGAVAGSGLKSLYRGEMFTKHDVVFVSFNYRLGALGFLPFPPGVTADFAPALSDQLQLLRWVKENISKFGGDPENLTLVGHSMGAASIRYLLDHGLVSSGVRAAALLSGGRLNETAPERPLAVASGATIQEMVKAYLSSMVAVPHTPPRLETWHNVDLLEAMVHNEGENKPVLGPMIKAYRCSAQILGERSKTFTYLSVHADTLAHEAGVESLFENSALGRRVRSYVAALAWRETPSWLYSAWSRWSSSTMVRDQVPVLEVFGEGVWPGHLPKETDCEVPRKETK